MGNKDKTRDETAATSSMDESRDTALARTIALAVAEAFAKQKAEETKLITETFTRQMEKTEAQYQELLKASRAQSTSSTLKISSGSQGFRVRTSGDQPVHIVTFTCESPSRPGSWIPSTMDTQYNRHSSEKL